MATKYASKIIATFVTESKEKAKQILTAVEDLIISEGGKISKYSTFYGEGTGSADKNDGKNVADSDSKGWRP